MLFLFWEYMIDSSRVMPLQVENHKFIKLNKQEYPQCNLQILEKLKEIQCILPQSVHLKLILIKFAK